MTTRTRLRTAWPRLTRWMTALAVLASCLATAPAAHADSAWAGTWSAGTYYVSAYPQYSGWAKIVPARGTPTITTYRQRIPVWKWTSSGWVASSAEDMDGAWVQPMGGGWSWAYARTPNAWFAVPTANIVVVR